MSQKGNTDHLEAPSSSGAVFRPLAHGVESGEQFILKWKQSGVASVLTWSRVSDLQISWEAGSAFTDV